MMNTPVAALRFALPLAGGDTCGLAKPVPWCPLALPGVTR